MKSIFLALALIATGVHAAEESDNNPCDAVENDVQTLECSTYSRTTAEDLLKDNYASLTERMQTAYGKNPGCRLRGGSVPGDGGQQGVHDCAE